MSSTDWTASPTIFFNIDASSTPRTLSFIMNGRKSHWSINVTTPFQITGTIYQPDDDGHSAGKLLLSHSNSKALLPLNKQKRKEVSTTSFSLLYHYPESDFWIILRGGDPLSEPFSYKWIVSLCSLSTSCSSIVS